MCVKKVFKEFKEFQLKNLGNYHDFCVQSDTLFLAFDVFENFRNKCMEIYELDPAHFLSAPGLAWHACLKTTGVKLESLTDIDMLLLVEKGIRGRICHAVHRYAKGNNKYMKNYDKKNTSLNLMYLDVNNLYGWAMSKKFPVNGFAWVEEPSQFNKDFITNYDGNSNEGHFLEVDVEHPKKLFNLHNDLPFLPERKKTEKCNKLVCNIHDKENYFVYIRV